MSLKDPAEKYRALPFWSWNGALDEKELERQVGILKEMGFGGAFMHSRCGLATEYLSKRWMSCIKNTADKFAAEGMSGWLYDEDRWPSGSCGGAATEKKENRQKSLSMYIGNDGYGDKRVIGAFAVRLTDGKERDIIDYKKIGENDPVPEGYEKAVFVEEFIEPSDFYNGNTYLDTLDRSAVQDFISLTHERYKAACGDKFGKEIKGVFTDEPHRGGVFNGFNVSNKNAGAMLPWSYGTFDLYAEKFGERVEEKLPELFFGKKGEIFNRTVWRYLETLQTQFLQAFAKPYHEWCKANGLLVTGHVWEENTLRGQISWQGSVMRYYEYMDIPGIDNLRDDNYFFAAPLQAVSVAKQTGKKEILSEMYACTGWKTDFDYYKRSGDWQAALGINVRCPHLSWYTMGGEAKRDCPASIFFQSGWYREYKYLEDYFARLKMTFGEAEYMTETVLLSPIESAWGLVRAGNYADSDRFVKAEADWLFVIENMLFDGIDFDVADEDILSRLGSVSSEKGVTYLNIGKMKYKTAVLPPLINVRLSTLGILREFADRGGKIVIAEAAPLYVDGVRPPFCVNAEVVPTSRLSKAIKACLKEKYSIAFRGKMLSKMKATKRGNLLFAIAFDCDGESEAKIVIDGEHSLYAINLRSGVATDIDYVVKDGKTVVTKTFVKGEELLLALCGEREVGAKTARRIKGRGITLFQTEFGYELGEPNVLPLDFAEYSVDGITLGTDEILKVDGNVRKKFGLKERSANALQPWFEEKYDGENYHKVLCRVGLKFAFDAEISPENAYLTAEDLPGAEWRLNGKILKKSKARPFIDDVCFSRYDLGKEYFRAGKNELSVNFDFTPACGMETVYLAGDFAVYGRTLRKKPEKIVFGDLCRQGFPFYTGAFTYKIELPDGLYDVEALRFGGACVRSGKEIAAFAPFAIENARSTGGVLPLTAVLTRRNLFGPLHEIPKNHGNYWSGSFRTTGEKFTEEYLLNEQGIFSAPKIYQREKRND